MSIKEWVYNKLVENNCDKQTVYSLYNDICTDLNYTVKRSTFDRMIRKVYTSLFIERGLAEEELTKDNARLAKKVQKISDINRIERKSFREHVRIDNALIEYNKQLICLLKEYNLTKFVKVHAEKSVKGDSKTSFGIIHLTDLHFNELVNLPANKYDFVVASQRLKKLATLSKNMFRPFGIKKVLIATTGDLLNSDRRLDELLSMANNRSKATILSVKILQQFILDINKEYNVSVTGVSGNESRVNSEQGYSEIVATDNYDFTILEILSYLFNESKGVTVFRCGYNEGIVELGLKNILLLHGFNQRGAIEKYIQQIKGKYAAQGTIIHYVLLGHLHSCRIGDQYARSSSLVGSNDYSDAALNLSGKASQNIFIVKNDDIHGIRVDLQSVDNIEGYDISHELQQYNIKSYDKLKKYKKIYKV